MTAPIYFLFSNHCAKARPKITTVSKFWQNIIWWWNFLSANFYQCMVPKDLRSDPSADVIFAYTYICVWGVSVWVQTENLKLSVAVSYSDMVTLNTGLFLFSHSLLLFWNNMQSKSNSSFSELEVLSFPCLLLAKLPVALLVRTHCCPFFVDLLTQLLF